MSCKSVKIQKSPLIAFVLIRNYYISKRNGGEFRTLFLSPSPPIHPREWPLIREGEKEGGDPGKKSLKGDKKKVGGRKIENFQNTLPEDEKLCTPVLAK